MRSKIIRRTVRVPIYDVSVYVVVTDDAGREQRRRKDIFGPDHDTNYSAICTYTGTSRFGLLFKSDQMTIAVVAHEVFHLTHRILEYSSVDFDRDHHEAGAFLGGFLFDAVYRIVKKTIKPG